LENKYSTKYLKDLILEDLKTDPVNVKHCESAVTDLKTWLTEKYPEEKTARLDQIREFNLEELVNEVFTVTATCLTWSLLVSITGKVAHKLGFDDHAEAITTAAEIITIMCYSGGFELRKPFKYAQWEVFNKLVLSKKTREQADRAMFLPPMINEPEDIQSAWESPYLTINESVFCGNAQNTHGGEIGLDVINKMNQTALAINERFIAICEELPPECKEAEKEQKVMFGGVMQTWPEFKRESEELYKELIFEGNRFYFSHKLDQRFRVYASGYHVSTQGRPYKKALLELADKTLIKLK
jgi:hypothetical protein